MPFILLKKRAKVMTSAKWSWSAIWMMLSEVCLIDTGSEVILVDTGLPAGFPEEVPNEDSPIFTGKDICSYMDAFKVLGNQPEQVTKILVTLMLPVVNTLISAQSVLPLASS